MPGTPLRLHSRYNRWMNARLYDAAQSLSPEERFADRCAFFGSIGGALNHLVVADATRLRRFANANCALPLREADP